MVNIRIPATWGASICLLALALTAACEKPAPADASKGVENAAELPGQPTRGKFSVEVKISGSQEVYQLEGAPKPEDVQSKLTVALYATEAFEEGGPRKLKGLVNYDVKALPAEGGHDLILLGALNSPGANFDAGVNLQSTDPNWSGKSLTEMVDGAVAQFAERIGAQARVMGGDDDNLRAVMEGADEPESAKLMAIQEVRERRATKHIDVVRTFLSADQPSKLRLAACATLAGLGDHDSRGEILKVAEDFSRERDPMFVPMLHILSDLGGPEVLTYLETVADAHAAPAVRTVAQEALEKARSGRSRATK